MNAICITSQHFITVLGTIETYAFFNGRAERVKINSPPEVLSTYISKIKQRVPILF